MQTSVVTYKKVENDSDCFRIDAEFFKKEYLVIDDLLRKKQYKHLEDFGVKIYHPNEIKRNYVDSNGVLFLRAQNVRPLDIDLDSNKVFISEEDAKKINRNQIKYTDILITRTGANFGQCAIYLEKEKAIASSHTFIVRIQEVNPFFITVFLNTKYGRKLIDKGMYGAVQPEVAPFYLYRIPVPLLSDKFYLLVEKIYKKSFDLITSSKELYSQAEQILLSELGLLNWKPKHRLSFIRNFSDTQSADRIDAEYFQPIYGNMVRHIKQYKKGYQPLGEIVKIKDKNFQPKDDATYQYIELTNISANGNINGFIQALGKELPSRARRKVNAGDVIASTIEGSLSSIALISDDLNNALCSTGFFVINSERINSQTLLVLLKSLVGQLQLKKGCSGTILTAISNDEFKRIILPELPSSVQEDIKNKISKMYSSKKLSKRLLDIAKRGVEMAIEKNEKDAERWIESEINRVKGNP